LAYSEQFKRVYTLDVSGSVSVFDAVNGDLISQRTPTYRFSYPNYRFTDFSLTPDGRYLFAADFGGERVGYGNPLSPHYVHRFDSLEGTWLTQQISGIAFQIEAVRHDRILLKSSDQWTDVSLYAFNSGTVSKLDEVFSGYSGDIEFDYRTGIIVHAECCLQEPQLMSHILTGDDLRGRYTSNFDYLSYRRSDFVSLNYADYAMSSDGSFFYYGKIQVKTADIATVVRLFPRYIYAATGTYAFSENTFYNVHTGELAGTLDVYSRVQVIGKSGQELAMFHRESGANFISFYRVPEPGSCLLFATALLLSATGLVRRSPTPCPHSSASTLPLHAG
jgi:hypothetical protein